MKTRGNPKRIMALDVGDKRVGMAVSDPLGLTAQPLETLVRGAFQADCAAILRRFEETGAEILLIGLPVDSEGSENRQCEKVRFFGDGLRKFFHRHKIDCPIEWIDESYSSIEAENILLEADLGREKRKRVIDKLAAAVILQRYLDERT